MEPNIIVRGRQVDADLVRNAIPGAVEKYKQLSGKDCNVYIDQENFLPQNTTGGVEILAQTGRIKVISDTFHITIDCKKLVLMSYVVFVFRLLTHLSLV